MWLEAAGRQSAKLVAFAESIDDHVRERAPSPFARGAAAPQVNEDLLAEGVAALARQRGLRAARRAGCALLRDAGDADLVRIRPFELAER